MSTNGLVQFLRRATTGAAAIDYDLTIARQTASPQEGNAWELAQLTAHFSADPGVGNLVVTLEPRDGAAYDTVLLTQAMSGVTNFVWTPAEPYILLPGDKLNLAMANAAGRTYGILITLREANA